MSATQTDRAAVAPNTPAAWIRGGRRLIVLAFCVGFLAYVILSWHWPLIWDMQVMHYVSFLIDKGWSPYREIWDMNMPGAYLCEGWALHLFGSSDVGWRLYDLSLCAVLLGSMIAIARRYDWLAGFVAGGIFIMVHASEGAITAGQREQEIMVLLVLGLALCFESVRRLKPWLMLPFGLVTAMAASIKPTFILVGPVVLLLALIHLHRKKVRWLGYAAWTVAGFGLSGFIVLRFLIVHDSLQAFLFDLTKVIPHYAGTHQATWAFLLGFTLPRMLFVYVGIGVLVALLDRNLFDWEIASILAGLFFGLLSYYGQHKGFAQHRYPQIAFALLWASIQIFVSMRGKRRAAQYLAFTAIVLIVVLLIPNSVVGAHRQAPYDNFSRYLEQDLTTIGTEPLQHKVECLDVVDGCLIALYHLGVVQSNGATGDLDLFLHESSASSEGVRRKYWAEIQKNEPTAFVLSNFQFGFERSFHSIDQWPAFASFLRDNYEVVAERQFAANPPTSIAGADPAEPAYRIYLRKGSPLLAAARQREAQVR